MQTVHVRSALSVFVVATSLLHGCATKPDIDQAVSADEPSMAAATSAPVSAYVINSDNQMVISPPEKCVRTTMWSAENALGECDQVTRETPAPKAGSELVSYNGRALFDFDSAILTGAGRAELDNLTAKLNAQDKIKAIQIVGHADSIGSDTYNQKLSENRANAVKQYVQSSLNTVTVSAKGMGETVPVADNNTEAGRRLNRRVDVNIAAMVEQ